MNNQQLFKLLNKILSKNELAHISGGTMNNQECYWEMPWGAPFITNNPENHRKYPAVMPIKKCFS